MATSFIYFPLLPTEIRLQIWGYAQSPRVVKIHTAPDPRVLERPLTAQTNYHAWLTRRSRLFCFNCLNPIPATLAVNRESREQALESYVVVCDDSGPRFYYNFMLDTLWVEQHEYADDFAVLAQRIEKSSPGTQVRSVAIQGHAINHFLGQSPNLAELVWESGVQELFIIIEVEEGKEMPSVWPLCPRTQYFNGVDMEIYRENRNHTLIALQFMRREVGFRGDMMPRVTAVERAYWEDKGLELQELESHPVVMDDYLDLLRRAIGV